MHEMIESRANRIVVETAKLKERKFRDQSQLFVFEGKKLLSEAIASGVNIRKIFVAPGIVLPDNLPDEDVVFPVSDSVYKKLSFEQSPEGVFCVAEKPGIHKEFIKGQPLGKIFIISSIRDPGNMGTILRSAAAFSVDTVIFSDDCADIFSPKTIRASMGALFRLNTRRALDLTDAIASLSEDYDIYAAALSREALPLKDISVRSNTAFVVGNEGHGLDREVISACQGSVIIPIAEASESLNASVAAAILMWEMKNAEK